MREHVCVRCGDLLLRVILCDVIFYRPGMIEVQGIGLEGPDTGAQALVRDDTEVDEYLDGISVD